MNISSYRAIFRNLPLHLKSFVKRYLIICKFTQTLQENQTFCILRLLFEVHLHRESRNGHELIYYIISFL